MTAPVAVDFETIIALIGAWGYVLVFAFAMLEAMPFVGMLVPGSAAVVIAGFLASRGEMNFLLILVLSTTANIVGDGISYSLARAYGRPLFLRMGKTFAFREATLNRAEALFVKYGPAAVIVSRFSMVTRGLGPFLAGMSRMRGSLFWLLALSGSLAWSLIYASLGFVFGASFLYLEAKIGRIVLVSAIVAIGIVLLYRALRKTAIRFTRYDALLAAIGGLSALAFGRVGQLVLRGDAEGIDALGAGLATDSPVLLLFYRFLDLVAGVEGALAVAAVVAIALALRKRHLDAVLVGVAVTLGTLLIAALKTTFHRARPAGGVLEATGFSFPSGHATIAVVLLGTLAYVAGRTSSRRGRIALGFAAGIGSLLVAISRLGLGVHFTSDVVGGLLAGLVWLSVVLLLGEWMQKAPVAQEIAGRALKRNEATDTSPEAPREPR